MGSSLYSRPETPIRELIQNAHDAIMRRRQNELDYQGRIDIIQSPDDRTLTFIDDGVGLSFEDAEEYLGTLGIGITGLLKGGDTELGTEKTTNSGDDLIGQFGIGMFSAFMLADRITVESRRSDCEKGVRWQTGAGTEITISEIEVANPGTRVILEVKSEYQILARELEPLETAVKEFADFLPIPIYINQSSGRANVINVAWFEPTADQESIEMELESYFSEAPLDVIPIRMEKPVSIAGALYVTPQRTPGFADDPVVAVTIRRMVISRRIQGLLPPWANFLRGVLELQDCSPTANREDLVKNHAFERVQMLLEKYLFEHFESLAESEPKRLHAIINWHRYTLAGAALSEPRLRQILRKTYQMPTSHGLLTFDEIIERSDANPLNETDYDKVVWYNSDRRQERWVNQLFSSHSTPCVHTLRSFEESLLAAIIADTGESIDLRIASPSATNFASTILGIQDLDDLEPAWVGFLEESNAKISCASFQSKLPVMAFLNERYELSQTFEQMKKDGDIPPGFQRLIDSHFQSVPASQNEVVLNRNHKLVSRALKKGTKSPLASVLRLLVNNALVSAGAAVPRTAQDQQLEDLDWIAEALWGKD